MNLLVKLELEAASGVARDNSSMSLAVRTGEPVLTSAERDEIFDSINDFLNQPFDGAEFHLGNYLSDSLKHTAQAGFVRFYDITGKEAPIGRTAKGNPIMPNIGSPIHVQSIGLIAANPNVKPLPPQVQLRCTLRAFGWEEQPAEMPDDEDVDTRDTRPRARYTGGILVGPWNEDASTEVNGEAVPTAAVRQYVGQGMQRLVDRVDAMGVGYDVCVWSREGGVLRPVEDIQVPNVFGTVRRRARRTTSRLTFNT